MRIGTEVVLWAGFRPYRAGKAEKLIIYATVSKYQFSFFGNKKRDTIYQLADFYTMFYFSYIKDNYGRDEHFWTNSVDLPLRRSWAGYTFEQLCLHHLDQIRRGIGISAVQCESSAWFSKGDGGNRRGAQ